MHRPEFRYEHKHYLGDIVAWDTAATMHKAGLSEVAAREEDVRVLFRVSVKGLPPSVRG